MLRIWSVSARLPLSWLVRTLIVGSACAFGLLAYGQEQKTPASTESAATTQPAAAQDKKIEGFGVIDRVVSADAEPVFQADGYRIRIVSTTATKFGSGLKTLADVGTNTWVGYEGRRLQGNEILASRVAFVKARKLKLVPQEPYVMPTEPSLIDADGALVSAHKKIRMSDASDACGWHKVVMDVAMQERVRRLGMNMLPTYQKDLPDDSPSKLRLRIYVVEAPEFHEDIECTEGMVLIPRQVVERLTNDDQLAAIMANAVAYSIEMQSARLFKDFLEINAAEFAGFVAGDFVPGGGLVGSYLGGEVVGYEIHKRQQEQAARISLTLMADAGYDPRQAPEAWKLLWPKKLPKDLSTLEYPGRAKYQLDMLGIPRSEEQAGKGVAQ